MVTAPPSEESIVGSQRSSLTYEGGVYNETIELYYESGQLQLREVTRMTELDDEFELREQEYEMYYKDGQLWERVKTSWRTSDSLASLSETNKEVERYSENGQLIEKGTTRDGGKCGEWVEEGRTVTYDSCLDTTERGLR